MFRFFAGLVMMIIALNMLSNSGNPQLSGINYKVENMAVQGIKYVYNMVMSDITHNVNSSQQRGTYYVKY